MVVLTILQGLTSFRKVSDLVSDFIQGLSSSDVEHAVYSVTVVDASLVSEHSCWETALRIS